jgi:hypothetical protein
MDTLGQILWWLIFASPIIIIPLVWKLSKQKKIATILKGLLISGIISLILYFLSLAIIFREGMGS